MDVTFIDAFEDLDTLKELFSEYASLLVSVNSDFGKYLTIRTGMMSFLILSTSTRKGEECSFSKWMG